MKEHKTIETDVLVVGGSIAAGLAAIGAREYPVNVTLADKGTFGRSGCAALASGVWHCFLPGDDPELWYREYIDAGVPLVDHRLMKKYMLETAKMVHKLEQWGVKFVKNPDGSFARSKATGDSVPRNTMLAGSGPQMMMAIRKEARRRGVRVLDKVMIADLLTSDGRHPTRGRVSGATGFHIPTGEVHVIKAKTTILAAGGIRGLPYATAGSGHPIGDAVMPNNITGDAFAMAFRAGAELTDAEFLLANSGVYMRDFACAPSMNLFFGLGARLINRLGQRFMEKYDPVRRESAHRWVTGVAVAREYREDRGPVVLDCTSFTPEQIALCKKVVPILMESLEKGGYDITEDVIAYVADYGSRGLSGGGGVRTGDRGESSIPGLYAAGASTLTALRALPGCAISGWHAGEKAAEDSLGLPPAEWTGAAAQVEQLKTAMLAPLDVREGVAFDDVHAAVAGVLRDDIGIFMHGERLSEAEKKLAALAGRARQVGASDYHHLSKALGLQNFIQTLELCVRSAMRRTESREGFVREDCPQTDNIDWLKHIVMRRDDYGIHLREEPVPAGAELPVERTRSAHLAFRSPDG